MGGGEGLLHLGVVVPWLLVFQGLHVVQRQIIFVHLALAQVAALGTCVGLLLGCDVHSCQSYIWWAAFTVAGAVMFTLTRTRHHRVPQEALGAGIEASSRLSTMVGADLPVSIVSSGEQLVPNFRLRAALTWWF